MTEFALPRSDLARLIEEILTGPASAALPSRLPDDWLMLIARDLEESLGNREVIGDATPSYATAPLALILHILLGKSKVSSLTIPLDKMHQYFCEYRIEVNLEIASRSACIEAEPATLETIFSNRQVGIVSERPHCFRP